MIRWLLRAVVAAGLLGSAWVHYVVWRDWAAETDVVGLLFLVNVVAGVVIAVAVLLWHHWLPVLAAIGFGLATLAAYVLSLTTGFFGVTEQFTTQAETWGLITEAACVVFGVPLLFNREGTDR
ncbi:hypothetical protein [Amycolatopsis sp. NPDC051071]|uniref:hypothetical protein n=1 Tax=Amycolatopsis sp. NPDC051071 TaxID=3154637 RepID=UPI00341A5CF9